MSDTNHLSDRRSVIIWVWLVGLLIAGMAVFTLHLPTLAALAIIFGIAAIKATLVLRDYMHLKAEPRIIYLIAFVPILLAIAMALVLIPDLVYNK